MIKPFQDNSFQDLFQDLNRFGLKAVEKMINDTLQYDPGTLIRLEALNNKSIVIQCTAPTYSLLITVESSTILLEPALPEQASDAVIRGPLFELLQLLTSENKQHTLINSTIEISGNSHIVTELQKIIQQLDIDWEAILSKAMGDIPAHGFGEVFRNSSEFSKKAADRYMTNMGEYLQEETQILPSRHELEDFYQAVDELRLQSDRMQARISQLLNNINKDKHK